MEYHIIYTTQWNEIWLFTRYFKLQEEELYYIKLKTPYLWRVFPLIFLSFFCVFFGVLINLLKVFSKRRLVFIFSALSLEQPRADYLAPESIKYMWLSTEIDKNCILFNYFRHVSSVECLGNRPQAKKNKLSLSDNLKKTTKH